MSTEAQAAYPTDSKAREKAKKKADKEAGIERPVVKRKKIMEDHYDDCGDDMSSLHDDEATVGFASRQCYDFDDVLSDEDHDYCLKAEFKHRVQCYPIDVSKVARAQPGSAPHKGIDDRACAPKDSSCPGCKHYRARDDWEHTREIGQCRYPYDEPWIPGCPACQSRYPRHHHEHTYQKDCKWGQDVVAPERRRSDRPHEPKLKANTDPTVGIPATIDGQEIAKAAEDEVAEQDRQEVRQPVVQQGGASSSTDPAPTSGGMSTEASGEQRNTRGPDQEPRHRRAWRDQGDNPEKPNDWTNFDIGRVVRLFRTNREGASGLCLAPITSAVLKYLTASTSKWSVTFSLCTSISSSTCSADVHGGMLVVSYPTKQKIPS